jgi:hypothetical protein
MPFMAKTTPKMAFQGPGTGTTLFQKMGKFGGYGGYGSSGGLYDLLIGNKMKDDVYASRQEMRKTESQLRIKMTMMMFKILMGDVAGAIQIMAFQNERQSRLFNSMIIEKMGKLRAGKTKILLALGRKSPPQGSGDPQAADADRKAQMKYTSWSTVTTQLLGTMQQSEQEMNDFLTQGRQHTDQMWDLYQSIAQREVRTDRTVSDAIRE